MDKTGQQIMKIIRNTGAIPLFTQNEKKNRKSERVGGLVYTLGEINEGS